MNKIPNYRVWHKIEKRFVDLRNIDFELESIGYDCQGEANYYDVAKFDEIVFQQWTGFVDAKGVDVYEGDFLDDSRFPITFNNGKFVVAVSGARIFVLEEFFEESIEPTVRGNIFENSELLNKKIKKN